MTVREVSIWTCQRCLNEFEMPGGQQPANWGSVQIFRPPKASPDADGAEPRVNLCPSCLGDLRRFLEVLPQVASMPG